MKSYNPVIVAFLLGAFAVAAGWGGAIYAALSLIGLVSIAVFIALIWTGFEQKDREHDEKSQRMRKGQSADHE